MRKQNHRPRSLQKPSSPKRKPRGKLFKRIINQGRHLANTVDAYRRKYISRRRFLEANPHYVEGMEKINKMTNWQRSQWGKAGYKTDEEVLDHFLTLEHPHKQRREAARQIA